MNTKKLISWGVILLGVLLILLGVAYRPDFSGDFDAHSASLGDFGSAPDFVGLEGWFNSEPLTLSALRGRVVLVDFWTYSCGNCLRTLPHVKEWSQRYRDQGLTVVGVHTPEFPYERERHNVDAAIKRFGIGYPVAQDNDYATWNAYRNKYWPAVYLIDRRGRIAFKHYGEGDYDKIDAALRALLAAAP